MASLKMQQAIVISSHYDAASGYPNLASWTPSAELLAARLAQHGYDIERLLPGAGLIRRLRSYLREENPHASVVLYFSGYTLVTENGDPALLLSDESVTALRLGQLVSRASRSFGRVFLLLDTTLGSSRGDVENACRAMDVPITSSPEKSMGELAISTCDAENVSVLMSVRAWGHTDKRVSPFARLLEQGLKELSNAHMATTDGDLYAWLRRAPEAEGLTLRFLAANPSFIVLPRRQYPSNPAALAPSPMVRMGVVAPLPPPAPVPPPADRASINPPEAVAPASLDAPVTTLAPEPFAAKVAPATPAPAPTSAEPEPAASPSPGTPSFTQDHHVVESPDQAAGDQTTPRSHADPAAHGREGSGHPTPPDDVGPQGLAELEPFANVSAQAQPVEARAQPADSAAAGERADSGADSPAAPTDLDQLGDAVLARAAGETAAAAPPVASTAPPVEATTPPADNDAAEAEAAPAAGSAEASAQLSPEPAPPAEDEGAPAGIPSQPPRAPSTFAGPESWRPPPEPAPPRDAEDEAGLLARARRAQEEGQDEEALALARKCLTLFPQAVAALQIAATVLAKLERWQELAGLYEQLIAGHLDAQAVSKLCIAASRLYTSKLNSPRSAAKVLERACELQPKNSAAHLEAAAFYESESQIQAAENHYLNAMRVDPLNVRCYRRASAFFAWTRQMDRAWNAASVVASLGRTNQVEDELLEKYGAEGLPRPSRPLASADFASGLCASSSDPGLAQLFSFLGETVRAITLPKPKVQQQMVKGCSAEDPNTSTTTLARAFNWTCQLFSIGTPALYLAEGDHLPALLPMNEAAWLVGKGIGRGLSAQELVFLWARALSRVRQESRASLYVDDSGGLTTLIDACFAAVGRMESPDARTGKLAKALKKKLDAPGVAALADKLDGISPNTAHARVLAWERQLELVANRMALLACGSPRVAASVLERFPMGTTPHQDQLADLFSFAMGQSYRTLRSDLGLAVR